jgi:hypothetical protein
MSTRYLGWDGMLWGSNKELRCSAATDGLARKPDRGVHAIVRMPQE